jgi:bacteriocin-like protein
MSKTSKKPGKQGPPATTQGEKTVSQELSDEDLAKVSGGSTISIGGGSPMLYPPEDSTSAQLGTLTTPMTNLEVIEGTIQAYKRIYNP